MTDDDLSRELRAALPDYCWTWEQDCNLPECAAPWCGAGTQNEKDARCGKLRPSPAVAYALAEKVPHDEIRWIARDKVAYVSQWDRKKGWIYFNRGGPTRAEAECRALLALMERIKDASGD